MKSLKSFHLNDKVNAHLFSITITCTAQQHVLKRMVMRLFKPAQKQNKMLKRVQTPHLSIFYQLKHSQIQNATFHFFPCN